MRSHYLLILAVFGVISPLSNRPALAIGPPARLQDLLKLYRELELPLPPKTAKLLSFSHPMMLIPGGGIFVADTARGGFGGGRIGGGGFAGGGIGGGGNAPNNLSVAIVTKDAKIQSGPTFFAQFREQIAEGDCGTGQAIDVTKPISSGIAALDDVLVMAIQCQALDLPIAARSFLARCPESSSRNRIHTRLRKEAWNYWYYQLLLKDGDRPAIAKRLGAMLKSDPGLATAELLAFSINLDKTLKPSIAKPGSVEALIDALVEFKCDDFETDVSPFWQLHLRGFEAVPDLLSHLNDGRMTRGVRPVPSRVDFSLVEPILVQQVVAQVLETLAGISVPSSFSSSMQTSILNKQKILAWWLKVHKQGEEAYLVSQVLKDDRMSLSCRSYLTHLLLIKYPGHLMAIYDAARSGNLQMDSHAWHLWWRAFASLAILDKQAFIVFLIERLNAIPRYVSGSYPNTFEVRLASLTLKSTDPQVWKALERAAKQTEIGLRIEILGCLSDPEEKNDLPEHYRFLLSFLNDDQIRDRTSSFQYEKGCAASEYEKIAVRDFAALQICKLAKQDVPVDAKRTADEWAKIRLRARQLADQKLKETK
ncbi:hypothetical protein BH10PLA2_BH10PLA2_34020 [soil metagenome]